MSNCLRHCVVVLVLLMGASAVEAQTPADQAIRNANLDLTIANLKKSITMLTERVAQLEARLAAIENAGVVNLPLGKDGGVVDVAEDADAEAGDQSGALGAVIDGHVMSIKSFERRAMDERPFTEAIALRSEAREHETKADKLEREKTDLKLCNGHRNWPACGCSSKDIHKKHAHEREMKQQELARQITRLRSDANSCAARAARLERDARIPRQTIYGWDGTRAVILHTDRNLERVLSRLDLDDGFITWLGDLKESNADGSQTWVVKRVAAVEKPEGFVEEAE